MPNILWRIIIVAIIAIFLTLLVPLILSGLGFNVSGLWLRVIQICLAGIAIWYIIWGPAVSTPKIN